MGRLGARNVRRRLEAAAFAFGSMFVTPLLADDALPPWTDRGDVPLPSWARSVAPNRPESAIYAEPGRPELRRGSAQPGARLPLFATRRAKGCPGRWLNVGAHAWMCSDVADFSEDAPSSPLLGTRPWTSSANEAAGEAASREEHARPSRAGARTSLPPIEPTSSTDDGLPYRYFFAGSSGAYGFANLARALDDAPDQELEPGFAVAIVEETTAHGERWGRTKAGRWVAMRELGAVRPSLFRGALLDPTNYGNVVNSKQGSVEPAIDVAWVVADKAQTFASDKAGKPTGTRVRFERLRVFEERASKGGGMVRVSSDAEPAAWMRARDLARPRLVAPPPEIVTEGERWIDVDLASQTLVAYVGRRPVFATLVSTGKGPPGSEFATRPGTFRIWVKVFATKMDNLDEDDVARHYAIEDVPWVQFFDKAIGFHAAFWHRDFGRVRSHGCVNLAPLDARWLFAFTSPHLPTGWTAVLPTKIERGGVVHVH